MASVSCGEAGHSEVHARPVAAEEAGDLRMMI
jgi:hypothetical protein